MKYQPIIDEDIEIKDFVQKFLKQPNKYALESFLSEKIDPKHKCVVKLFDVNNCVNERKINDISKINSNFYNTFYKKVKLQIRLEDTKDVDNLINFLYILKSGLKEFNEEFDINQHRFDVLKEIFEDDNPSKLWI